MKQLNLLEHIDKVNKPKKKKVKQCVVNNIKLKHASYLET